MRTQLIVILLVLAIGYLAGDRYGAPEWARGIAAAGFSKVEGVFGRVAEPLPAAEEDGMDGAGATAEEAAPEAPATSDDLGNAANAGLRINDAGLQIIKESEGLRLEAYSGVGGWYIGYGHSGAAPGQKITEQEAEQLLRDDVRGAEDTVRKLVRAPLNENQFSALVSLAYNLGSGGFSRSSVLDALNEGRYAEAADKFRNHNKADGAVIEHLTERREKERALFLASA